MFSKLVSKRIGVISSRPLLYRRMYRGFSSIVDNRQKYVGMNGGRIIYEKLLENNVKVVNGFSGGANLPILDAFHSDHHGKPRHRPVGRNDGSGGFHCAGRPNGLCRHENVSAIYYPTQPGHYLGSDRSLGVSRQTDCSGPVPDWNQNWFCDSGDRHHRAGHPSDPAPSCANQTVLENVGPDDVPGFQFQLQPLPFFR